MVVVAVLCGGFGGPEERIYASIYGFIRRSGKGNGVDGGVERGFGIGVVKGTARSMRVF